MDEDLPHVRDAAKVSLGELNKDMAQLRAGLKDVAREIEFHRSQSPLANDKFVPVMREFQATATCRLAEVEDQYQDMKVSSLLINVFSLIITSSNIHYIFEKKNLCGTR